MKRNATTKTAPVAPTSLMRNNEPNKLMRAARIATSTVLVAGLLIAPIAPVDAQGMSAQAPGQQNRPMPHENANERAHKNTDRSEARAHKKELPVSAQSNSQSQKPNTPNQNSHIDETPAAAPNNQRAEHAHAQNSQQSIARPAPKVTICHRSNSATNAYVAITVSAMAVKSHVNSGHDQHEGPVANSEDHARELKSQKIKWGDIIPPVAGITSGQNWNTQNQEIHANGCQVASDTSTEDEGDVIGDTDEETSGKGGVDHEAEEEQDTPRQEEGDTLSASAQADYPDKLPTTGASSALALLLSLISGTVTGAYSWMRTRKSA